MEMYENEVIKGAKWDAGERIGFAIVSLASITGIGMIAFVAGSGVVMVAIETFGVLTV